ncbi:MAG TPA: lysylphosphatidylglycerol synthase transmembrane domain-containing protein, partial [Bellilinea sp.]|nr:lysylphosphatidylglycerol synthase transmembrane domain-containing protein [Bellilinea sp.]
GVSYFTAGPQVGGEPLQVMLVAQNQKVKFPAAVSSVFLDKVFQLLTNFTFLVFGSLWIFSRDILGNIPGAGWWIGAGIVLAVPLLHLLTLRRGVFPFSHLIQHLPRWSWLEKVTNVIAQSEELISRMLQTNTKVIFTAAIISAVGWLLMFAEYAFMLRFLGGTFAAPQVFLAFMASQLAFLTPLPGGLGALEASQVMIFTSFGAPAAIGLSVSLLMRSRDILFGLLGIVIATTALNKRSAQPRVVPVQEE